MSKESLAQYHEALVKDSRELFTKEQKIGIIAQSLLETGFGTSSLSDKNNFGGMMWRDVFEDISGCYPYKYTSPSDNITTDYVACGSPQDYINVYYAFIERSRYAGWKSTQSAKQFIQWLKDRGYATDPQYVAKVSSLFTQAEGIFYKYVGEKNQGSFTLRGGTQLEISNSESAWKAERTIQGLSAVLSQLESHFLPSSPVKISFSEENESVTYSDVFNVFQKVDAPFLAPQALKIKEEGAEITMVFNLREGYKYE